MKDRTHTDQALIDVLRIFADEMKQQAKTHDLGLFRTWLTAHRKMNPQNKIAAFSTFIQRFGSWQTALQKAALQQPDYAQTKRTLERFELSDVKTHFLICRAQGSGTFTPRKYQLYARSTPEAPRFRQLINQFQNWDLLMQELEKFDPTGDWNLFTIAETEPKQVQTKHNKPLGWNDWSNEQQKDYACEMIWMVSQMNNGDVSPKIYKRAQVYPDVSTIIRRFGSWDAAVQATLNRLVRIQRDMKRALIISQEQINATQEKELVLELDGVSFVFNSDFDAELVGDLLTKEVESNH